MVEGAVGWLFLTVVNKRAINEKDISCKMHWKRQHENTSCEVLWRRKKIF